MSDLQFELTDVDPQYFFSRDNLNSLKSSFPKIKLIQRGQTIKALGEKSELKEFDKKFRSLLNYYTEYNSIDPNVINDIVVKDVKFNGDKPSLILHGISGKPILAKTVNQKRLHNSITSNEPGPFATRSLHDWQIPHGLGVGPFSQFKDLAIIRALDVLPQPLGPLNKYAW